MALFDNDTKRQDYDQLAQTLTDAVVARLASDPSRLTVIGNSPILRQVRSFRDVTTIGAALNTEHVILGQVQEIAGRLRVTAHLIRAADEGHVMGPPLRADRERTCRRSIARSPMQCGRGGDEAARAVTNPNIPYQVTAAGAAVLTASYIILTRLDCTAIRAASNRTRGRRCPCRRVVSRRLFLYWGRP